ncbi:uncharacterized protein LOC143300129 [Babylonia areolata]|uniref:uncharacterized protein LOC143300129 n=1 Tax=Babylonia areolata TaxID=304850 RepID=UPI003FD6856E
MDPADLCHCGPCRRFWQDVLRNSYLNQAKEEGTLAMGKKGKVQHHHVRLSIGDRVTVHGKTGFVKFVDFVDDSIMAPVLRVGVRLDEMIPEGNDGVYLGKRYFHCTPGHGVFVRVTEVVAVPAPNKRPPIWGNTMFPSWPLVCQKRREQEAAQEEEKKKQRKAAIRSMQKSQTTLPSIYSRENRANQLRRERICLDKVPKSLTWSQEDPLDMAVKDQQSKKKKKPQEVICGPKPPILNLPTLKEVWLKKYPDPDKVDRMEETLQKLVSAYKEGCKFKQLYTHTKILLGYDLA